jgi:hypothetical protein
VLLLLQAAALGGVPEASPVGCCVLPASTVEQLETFFDTQLKQVGDASSKLRICLILDVVLALALSLFAQCTSRQVQHRSAEQQLACRPSKCSGL